MAMLTFYYADNSCALAAHIVLEQTGLAYSARRLDFSQGEQRSPEFLRINPKGRVPALVTDRGVLTEVPALMLYAAQRAPESGLAPLNDPFELGAMNAFNSYLASTVHVAHAHRVRGSRWADDPAAIAAMQAKVAQNMRDCFALIEHDMLRGPWVLGERYSTADAYLYTIGGWLAGDGVDIDEFPRVAEHHRRVAAEPAVQRVVSRHNPGS